MPSTPITSASPHRFLQSHRKTQPTAKNHETKSSLKHELERAGEGNQDQTKPQQFASTPRFTRGQPKHAVAAQLPSAQQSSAFVQSFRPRARPVEGVEDASTEDEDDEMLVDGSLQGPQIGAKERAEANDDLLWSNDLAFSPKRRRLSTAQDFASPARQLDHGLERTSNAISQLPRFQTPSAFPDLASEVQTTQRPAFKRPDSQARESSEPIPEVFSPHRRGQKFLPGGMAASVQQWVLETGQAAVQSRKGHGYLQGEDYVMRVKIEGAVQGNGPFTAQAQISDGEAVNLMLAATDGIRKDNIRAGSMVGIRAPTWEVDLDQASWTVAVDWRLLP